MQRLVRVAVLAVVLGAAAIVVVVLSRHHHPASVTTTRPSPGAPTSAVSAAARSIRSVPVDGVDVTIAVPRHPNGRAVFFMHGTDEDAALDLSTSPAAPLVAALLRAGYTWAEPGTAAENWGDPASVAQDLAAAGYLQASGHRIIVMAASMGGLDALQILSKVDPLAFVGIYPVCDLSSVIDANPSFEPLIASSGTSVGALSPAPIVAPSGLSVLLLASPQDTTVPKVRNADVCAAEARTAGMTVGEITTTGPHGDPSNWRPGPILGFLRRHLGD